MDVGKCERVLFCAGMKWGGLQQDSFKILPKTDMCMCMCSPSPSPFFQTLANKEGEV
jgi:hypothetical protein